MTSEGKAGKMESIWVIESRLTEPASQWMVEYDAEICPDELFAKSEIRSIRKLHGDASEYRVREYVPKEAA